MFDRILVPLDMSTAAEIAFPYAAEFAARLGSEICLASVAESAGSSPSAGGSMDPAYMAYFLRAVEQVRARAQDFGAKEPVRFSTKVLAGKPADEIRRYADAKEVSLILMASHGASGQAQPALGNVATKVLTATTRPVLLVKTPASGAALSRKALIRKILVPLDGSKLGETAVPLVEGLAGAYQADLVLLNVIEPQVKWGIYEASTYRTSASPDDRTASASAYLDNVARPLKEKGLNTTALVQMGLPARRIIDYAGANTVDLIAMSTHGRSGIMEWVFGSVTEKILNAGEVPVLVVRAAATS